MADQQDLKERVQAFNLMQLPEQPFGMHMGTSYLVNDLDREVERFRAELDEAVGVLRKIATSPELNDLKPSKPRTEYDKGYRGAADIATAMARVFLSKQEKGDD